MIRASWRFTLSALCLVITLGARVAAAWDSWGGHAVYTSPFDAFSGVGSWPLHRGLRAPYRAGTVMPNPCPHYKAAAVSSWEEDNLGHRIVARVEMPAVRPEHQQVWLDEADKSVRIRGFRPLPARGRACLPAGARLSRDGRYEVLDVKLDVPSRLAVKQMLARPIQGGLEISALAQRPAAQSGGAVLAESKRTKEAAPASPTSRPASGPAAPTQDQQLVEEPKHQQLVEEQHGLSVQNFRKKILESSDNSGIEVIDEPYPEPEKLPDAADGWWDNRGDFQYY